MADSSTYIPTSGVQDEMMMRRCLTLARCGLHGVGCNPLVGAVITAQSGRIIGEGFHQHYGEAHAEVNAFASIRPEDIKELPNATLYVSLEPCAHHGKTPPCADLIIQKGVRRVVCGCIDPYNKVRGRGIARLQEAGVSVSVGILEQECLQLNRRFIINQTLNRPYIMLKWAQTANGRLSSDATTPLRISTPWTQRLVHQLRASFSAILVGHNTMISDHPKLDVRLWSGPRPRPFVLSHQDFPGFRSFTSIEAVLQYMNEERLPSLLVEGGAHTLHSFIDNHYWDTIRVERSPQWVAAGTKAPELPSNALLTDEQCWDGNIISTYINPEQP